MKSIVLGPAGGAPGALSPAAIESPRLRPPAVSAARSLVAVFHRLSVLSSLPLDFIVRLVLSVARARALICLGAAGSRPAGFGASLRFRVLLAGPRPLRRGLGGPRPSRPSPRRLLRSAAPLAALPPGLRGERSQPAAAVSFSATPAPAAAERPRVRRTARRGSVKPRSRARAGWRSPDAPACSGSGARCRFSPQAAAPLAS